MFTPTTSLMMALAVFGLASARPTARQSTTCAPTNGTYRITVPSNNTAAWAFASNPSIGQTQAVMAIVNSDPTTSAETTGFTIAEQYAVDINPVETFYTLEGESGFVTLDDNLGIGAFVPGPSADAQLFGIECETCTDTLNSNCFLLVPVGNGATASGQNVDRANVTIETFGDCSDTNICRWDLFSV
ncbi:hypothetical protein MNV49_001268 [Pseudohyphozyma bogoriensis]|nr:hypothetical protein MNV49_001268 [Pseudohyphozyma bogoriensis]